MNSSELLVKAIKSNKRLQHHAPKLYLKYKAIEGVKSEVWGGENDRKGDDWGGKMKKAQLKPIACATEENPNIPQTPADIFVSTPHIPTCKCVSTSQLFWHIHVLLNCHQSVESTCFHQQQMIWPSNTRVFSTRSTLRNCVKRAKERNKDTEQLECMALKFLGEGDQADCFLRPQQ